MDPERRLACAQRPFDQRAVVDRRRLIGHQRGAGDAAGGKGGEVDREAADVDDPRRDQRAAGVDCRHAGGRG
jgi:hypothetical protein